MRRLTTFFKRFYAFLCREKIFQVLAQEEATHKLRLEREYDDNVYKEG